MAFVPAATRVAASVFGVCLRFEVFIATERPRTQQTDAPACVNTTVGLGPHRPRDDGSARDRRCFGFRIFIVDSPLSISSRPWVCCYSYIIRANAFRAVTHSRSLWAVRAHHHHIKTIAADRSPSQSTVLAVVGLHDSTGNWQ